MRILARAAIPTTFVVLLTIAGCTSDNASLDDSSGASSTKQTNSTPPTRNAMNYAETPWESKIGSTNSSETTPISSKRSRRLSVNSKPPSGTLRNDLTSRLTPHT